MIYTIHGPVVIYTLCMTAKIMSLYSKTKRKVKSRRTMNGDLRLKMPRFSEIERERAIGMFMGGASHKAVVRYFSVHRTIGQGLMRRLGETRSTRDRPYSGRPQVMASNQDRKICPPPHTHTHCSDIENMRGIV